MTLTTRAGRARTRTRLASATAGPTACVCAARRALPPAATTDPVETARRLAELAAGLPDANGNRLGRLAAAEAACDAHGVVGPAKAAIILREAVDWPAVYAHCRKRSGWAARRVNGATPAELVAALRSRATADGREAGAVAA